MLRSNQLSYTTEQGKIVNHFDCCLFQHLARASTNHQAKSRELLGTCAIKNSIWSAKMRRLRRMKSSHSEGS